MKALLKLLYILLFLVIAILLAGLFLPRDMEIESSGKIKSSPGIIFDQVNTLKNWENWSPWIISDTTVHLAYNNIPAGKGAEFRWVDRQSNEGSLKILRCDSEKNIDMHVDFGKNGDANIFWKFTMEENSIKVSWTFKTNDMSYFERYFMVIYKMSIQNDLNKGLKNLKLVCEELRLSRISAIQTIELKNQPAMIIIDSARIGEMEAKMKVLFEKLGAYLDKREIAVEGNRLTIYYKWDPKGFSRFACGFPIAAKTWGWKEYNYFELPECKAATLTHWGRYNSEKPYVALDNYLEENKLKQGEIIWEEYVKSAENEPDTSLWEKRIFYPLKP